MHTGNETPAKDLSFVNSFLCILKDKSYRKSSEWYALHKSASLQLGMHVSVFDKKRRVRAGETDKLTDMVSVFHSPRSKVPSHCSHQKTEETTTQTQTHSCLYTGRGSDRISSLETNEQLPAIHNKQPEIIV